MIKKRTSYREPEKNITARDNSKQQISVYQRNRKQANMAKNIGPPRQMCFPMYFVVYPSLQQYEIIILPISYFIDKETEGS